MNAKRAAARRGGFTLVELLVVIAIISILAAIVVPNVAAYFGRAQVARALTDIRGADTGLTAALADAGKSSFTHFLSPAGKRYLACIDIAITEPLDRYVAAEYFYRNFFYEILRQGRAAEVKVSFQDCVTGEQFNNADAIDPEVKAKLGASYLDITTDPWGHAYRFAMPSKNQVLHRSYRRPSFIWTLDERTAANREIPGQPQEDNIPGFPADKQKAVYIYSTGANEQLDAYIFLNQIGLAMDLYQIGVENLGGLDDINNWDSDRGWEQAPK